MRNTLLFTTLQKGMEGSRYCLLYNIYIFMTSINEREEIYLTDSLSVLLFIYGKSKYIYSVRINCIYPTLTGHSYVLKA